MIDTRNTEDIQVMSGDNVILPEHAVASVSTQAGASMIYVYSGMTNGIIIATVCMWFCCI